MYTRDKNISDAIESFILDSQIMLEVPESVVREIFEAGAKWQMAQLSNDPEAS